ncbi:MAG TPA: hypothetical protein VGL61_12510 [Kofleriaceae bacterium]|jgi:imidazolonepropionase-like amidohydrolase
MRRYICVGLLASCGSAAQVPPSAATSALAGHDESGRTVALALAGDKIASISPAGEAAGWLWPPIVDSHVHLAYWPIADELARRGIGVAVDLAAPERTLGTPEPLDVLEAGPMLTHPNGYPLDSWGSDGFGIGCADAACVTAAVDRLAAHGVRVIKLAGDDDGLAPELMPVAVAAAHAHHLKVAVHALSNASALAAANAGVDVLAHTPVEPLADATIAAWRGRAVISTLAAFGGSSAAVHNLARLRAAGVTVLYGTDLGNTRDAGPSAQEVQLLREAGLDDAAITDAMTTAPLAFWGISAGPEVGREATLVVLDGDPRRDASVLLHPRAVYVRGKRLR